MLLLRINKSLKLSALFYDVLCMRPNFSFVVRYSLKFTRCSLLVVKSLITRCKIRSLLVAAKVARYKKSLVTKCEIRLLLVAEVARCKNSLITHCKIHSLLVPEVSRCKKSLVTLCKIRLLLVATNHLLLNAKNRSLFFKAITSP